MRRLDDEADRLVFRYRLIHLAYFADERCKCDSAEAGRSLILLNFCKTQDSRNDGQGLIERIDRLVCDGLQLRKRCGVAATTLEHQPRSGQGCAQVMRNVVTDACERVDKSFHLVEH